MFHVSHIFCVKRRQSSARKITTKPTHKEFPPSLNWCKVLRARVAMPALYSLCVLNVHKYACICTSFYYIRRNPRHVNGKRCACPVVVAVGVVLMRKVEHKAKTLWHAFASTTPPTRRRRDAYTTSKQNEDSRMESVRGRNRKRNGVAT